MNIVLNVCHKDREQALDLLNRIRELGGAKKHDLFIISNVVAAGAGLINELEEVAQACFATVLTKVNQDIQDERGWPYSCNAAWLYAVQLMYDRVKRPYRYEPIAGKPMSAEWKVNVNEASARNNREWFWLEGDCMVLAGDCFDRIETEYREVSTRKTDKRVFMGAEVRYPQHRMSGVGVYPCWISPYTKSGIANLPDNKAPWDQVLANDFMPHVHFTSLIQNIWNREPGKPETIPSFPDQESLSLIDPKAVLFHRCKDGTLLRQLRQRENSPIIINAAAPVAVEPVKELRCDRVESQGAAAPVYTQEQVDAMIEDARKELKRYEQVISAIVVTPGKQAIKQGVPMKRGRVRTPEQVAADKARMAAVRAKRKKLTGVV